jgi:uncharacterized SAM-binding protein YcdF (DUF218 family)
MPGNPKRWLRRGTMLYPSKSSDCYISILVPGEPKNDIFIHYSYKTRGVYHEQLKRYYNYFPMSNILVLNSDAIFTQPNDTLRRIFEFFGVDTEFTVDDLKPRNVGTNRTKVDPDVYEYLGNYFRPHNRELYELIEENYAW